MGKEGAFGDERWTYLLRAAIAIAIAPRLPALFCRFSYFQNVCTQSYSMWWWSWDRWQREIDWAALWGVNLMLAYTGQEHVFREVFNSIGVNDSVLNTTFDGPAFLTWSRGQGQFGFMLLPLWGCPHISIDSVDWWVLSFCLVKVNMENPIPVENPPPVCPRMFECTA